MTSADSSYSTVWVSAARGRDLKNTWFTMRDGSRLAATTSISEEDDAFESSSSARTLLFMVHGLGSNRKMYQECALHLVGLGYTVVTIDLRYHGISSQFTYFCILSPLITS